LWRRIAKEYEITGGAAFDLLALAAEAIDRAEGAAARIAADGLMIADGKGAAREHPLIRHELAARAFAARTLMRLAREL
jgi:hypothetical protein